ncbi:MAG: hypothetical protein KGS61_03120 [Verrucomicrobia bacterium]|nr:hypothetical protein [Verrucomicrobiota bacterium]
MNLSARCVAAGLACLLGGSFLLLRSRWPSPCNSVPAFPVQARIGPSRVRPEIRVAGGHVLLLASDGSLWGWGANDAGALGPGLARCVPAPRRLRTGSDWMEIAAGASYTVGLQLNRTLWGWGALPGLSGSYALKEGGDLRDGARLKQVNADTNWRSITAGSTHVLALKTDGTLCAWGANGVNQLADGTSTDHLTPAKLDAGSNWTAIATGNLDSAGVRTDGSLWVWGLNPRATNRTRATRIGVGTNWVAVYRGDFHFVACQRDGSCWLWGANAPYFMSPTRRLNGGALIQLRPSHPWLTVTGGNAHCLALHRDGSLWSWGDNRYGQLGDGTTLPRTAPVRLGQRNDWIAIGAAEATSVALARDGSVWTWGVRLDLPQRSRPLARLAGNLARRAGVNVNWGRPAPPEIATTPWCILKFNQPPASSPASSAHGPRR